MKAMNRQIAGWITHHWTKWVILVVSILAVGGLGMLGGKLGSVQENDIAAWLPGDAESTEALQQAQEFSDPDDILAIVLYVNDQGISSQDLATIADDTERFAGVEHVTDVTAADQLPLLSSKDGKAVQVFVTMHLPSDGWEDLPDLIGDLKDIASDDSGLQTAVAGPAASGADQAEAFAGIDGILLAAALGIVFLVLLLTYRSIVIPVVFLLCAVAALGMAQGAVYLLAKYAGLTVNGQSAGILSVLVIGAGVDYALLLVARYREELRNYEDRHEAMAHALHRAAPAIIASGATVIIGLLCLMFAQMNSTAGLGPVAAAGIAIALLVMLVLLPAVFVILGRWIFWPFIPRFGDESPAERGLWARVGRVIAKRPRSVWVGTTLILAACTIGVVQLDANGLTTEESFTTTQPSVEAEKVLAEHFPGGSGSPVTVLASSQNADDIVATLRDVDGLDADSVSVQGERAGTSYIEATLTAAPDSDQAFDTVQRARDALAGTDALVGGNTAINYDVQQASGADNRLIIPIILAVVLIILMVLLRAVIAPLILLVTVVLSFGAALGLSALAFRHIFGWAGADTSLPLFCFVFLVALGIDYNIFLMTRVREEALRLGTRRGALVGLAATGGVITSAGLVLAGTFGALGSLPLVFMAEVGFAVALGVLLDTIIVRSVLVTSLNLDVGRWMWWPSRLWRTDGEVESRETAS